MDPYPTPQAISSAESLKNARLVTRRAVDAEHVAHFAYAQFVREIQTDLRLAVHRRAGSRADPVKSRRPPARCSGRPPLHRSEKSEALRGDACYYP